MYKPYKIIDAGKGRENLPLRVEKLFEFFLLYSARVRQELGKTILTGPGSITRAFRVLDYIFYSSQLILLFFFPFLIMASLIIAKK